MKGPRSRSDHHRSASSSSPSQSDSVLNVDSGGQIGSTTGARTGGESGFHLERPSHTERTATRMRGSRNSTATLVLRQGSLDRGAELVEAGAVPGHLEQSLRLLRRHVLELLLRPEVPIGVVLAGEAPDDLPVPLER